MRFALAELIASHCNGPQTVLFSERIGKGGADWSCLEHNNQPVEATQQSAVWRLGKDGEEEEREVRLLLSILPRCNYVWYLLWYCREL